MSTVKSKDGTTIAFDQSGTGPALILIGGVTQYRAIDPETTKRAQLLAPISPSSTMIAGDAVKAATCHP